MKALRVSGYVILALLLPYLYLLLGFRFVAPLGAAVSLTAAGFAFSRAMPAAMKYVPLAVGAFFCGGSALAWLHRFQ